jgi:hypothetical protein
LTGHARWTSATSRGDHGQHAGHRARGARVDADDARVGVGTAQRRGVRDVRDVEVVHEARAPGDEPRVLAAAHARADVRAAGRRRRELRRGGRPARQRQDGVDHALVAGAAAEVAGQRLADGVLGWRRLLGQRGGQRHEDPGRAEAALHGVVLDELPLERRQVLGVRRQPLHRRDASAIRLRRKHQARAHGLAVHEHGARAAHAVLAAEVRSRELELAAQQISEREARLDRRRSLLSVDVHADRSPLAHARLRASG